MATEQQEDRLFLLAPVPGDLATMVVGFLLLLQRRMFLLFDTDEAQIQHGGEHRRPGPDHHSGFSGPDAMPGIRTRSR